MKDISICIDAWDQLKKEIKKDFSNEIFYNNFFIFSEFYKNINKKCYIIVQNDFVRETLNKDYLKLIEDKYSSLLNMSVNVVFILDDEKTNISLINNAEKNINLMKEEYSELNKDLDFNNYIVGKYNKAVYVAAKNIIESNSELFFNPLFICGTTGLGKTHILNAIGLEFKNKYPDKIIKYINTEDFLRKAYDALSTGGLKIEEFKNSFDNIDLLLVDDIQFLSNKDKLNEIFFNIFNNLIKNKKIIVMTSDKVANQLVIDERMISRFNSGLSIRISKPDIETIKEIIINKINKSNRKNQFTTNAVNFIANRFNSDIRTLEGIINKILFYSLSNMDANEIINEDKVKYILEFDSDLSIKNINSIIDPNVIIETVCISYGVNTAAVISKKRQQQITFVRKVCMYILREKLNLSFSEIGSYFSKRDHTTVMDSYNYIKNKIEEDSNLKDFINNIIEKI